MTDGRPSVSVIVTSHQRPEWLMRCLDAVSRLYHAPFEVIVVADAASQEALAASLDPAHFKRVTFDETSLGRARNAGIAVASGDICAFIDDDAVPEPMWLSHLIDAFERLQADAIVGFVRGRNGISFQSRIGAVDREAETHQLPVRGEAPQMVNAGAGRALKLVGTNMAIARQRLLDVSGFDPDFDFFLDDADLSLRLAASGARLGAAPLAEVHHAFAPSARRTALRRPRRLFDVGRSTALYQRKHGAEDLSDLHDRLVRRERQRLARHLVMGTCEPRDVGRLIADLEAGWRAGLAHTLDPPPPLSASETEFLPFPARNGRSVVLSSRLIRRRQTVAKAVKEAQEGGTVSVFSFSLSPIRHHVRFADGVWRQTGGQFGRAARDEPLFRWSRFAKRLSIEMDRVAKQRGIGDIGPRRDTEDHKRAPH